MAKEISFNFLVDKGYFYSRKKAEKLIGWKRPPEGRVKMNSDGASNGQAGARGLLRDSGGSCLGGGFVANKGAYTSFRAKMCAVKYGL